MGQAGTSLCLALPHHEAEHTAQPGKVRPYHCRQHEHEFIRCGCGWRREGPAEMATLHENAVAEGKQAPTAEEAKMALMHG